jgi:hypothetical protein
MRHRMYRFLPGAFLLAMAAHSSSAWAQLVGETVQGTHKICRYGESRSFATGNERQQTLRVGLWANCPVTYSERLNTGRPPPTAMLYSQAIEGQVRRCIYEHLGYVWTHSVPLRSYCPIAAGMIGR